MNNNDKPHAVNDIYHVPTTLLETESFGIETVPPSDEVVEQQFNDIVREEVRLSFDEMTQNLARFASGEIEQPLATVETNLEVNTHAMEIIRIGESLNELHARHLAQRATVVRNEHFIGKLSRVLFSREPSPLVPLQKVTDLAVHKLVEPELKVVPPFFQVDAEVTGRKFFFLDDTWYLQQNSAVKSKNFTNSYQAHPRGVQKSATYFDENEGRVRNVSVPAAHQEVVILKQAAKHYHDAVRVGIYEKQTGPKNRGKSSGPRGRTR